MTWMRIERAEPFRAAIATTFGINTSAPANKPLPFKWHTEKMWFRPEDMLEALRTAGGEDVYVLVRL